MPDFREGEIHVRIDEDDENVTISFFLGGTIFNEETSLHLIYIRRFVTFTSVNCR
jgi:predicted proteasome-type protease